MPSRTSEEDVEETWKYLLDLLTENLVEAFCSKSVAPFARGDLGLNPNGKPRRGAYPP